MKIRPKIKLLVYGVFVAVAFSQHPIAMPPIHLPPQHRAMPTPHTALSEDYVHAVLSYYRGGYGATSETVPPARLTAMMHKAG